MKKRTMLAAFSLVFLAVSGCSSDDSSKVDQEAMTSDSTVQESTEAKGKTHPIRNENNQFATLETNFGSMTVELYHDVAPAHADSFAARVADGFYDNTIFHRVVKNFMIQGGNAQAAGKQQVKYNLEAEFNELPHKDGTLSMARSRMPNSAKTQFFLCLGRNSSTEYLDGKYTNFGQLIKGYDVLHAIGEVEVGPNKWMGGREVSAPIDEIRIIDAYISDAEGNPIEK